MRLELSRYVNCGNVTVDTIEQAYWCGPSQTWPQFEHNHAYVEFWHHLDSALAGEIARSQRGSDFELGGRH